MFELYVIEDRATPELQAQMANIRPEILLKIAGKRLEIELRRHFRARDAQGNARGWPSKHFWLRIANATALESVTSSAATVAIADPAFWGKYQGAHVVPKRGKFLAIPATAAAYAAGSPREGAVPDLVIARQFNHAIMRDMWCLIVKTDRKPQPSSAKAGTVASFLSRNQGEVWFWLARKADLPKDPDALPRSDALEDAIWESVQSFLARRSPGVSA